MVASAFNQVPEHLVHGVVVGTVKDEYFYKANDKQYFPIGAIYRKGDRAWRYVRVVANSNAELPETISAVCTSEDQAINQRRVTKNQAENTKEVTVTVTADDANSGVFLKDQLYGGYITVRESTTHNQTRLITGNEALAAFGDLKIFVDVPWETALTGPGSMWCSAIFSPYHAVVKKSTQNHNAQKPAIGVPVAPVTSAGQWVWIQTWGPCHVTCDATIGAAGHNVQAVFDYGGNLLAHENGAAYSEFAQHAGFIMNQLALGAGQAYEPFTFLQIAP